MPSFLSKVFGRKKQDDKESSGHGSDSSLLEGKFEAVSPNVSPTADKFLVGNGHKEKEAKGKDKGKSAKEKPFSVLKSRSQSFTDVSTPKPADFPHLTLNLPGLKDDPNARALGVVFESDPTQLTLSDAIVGSRRLTSLETLVLVRACSQAIMTRGLETLGIMHPHWHSSSPEAQRRLISLFIHSLAPKSPITTLSPTLSAPASAFESEISTTRSAHDIAAVLRWGIRHLQLDGNSFGNPNDSDWYKAFFEAEKSAQYPPTAFTDKLTPNIPATHLELLTAMLDVFSSLAAHSEANSTSGSKLSKLVGLWLLSADRAQPGDDWFTFYERWDRMGRVLEHLFLSHIRNEAINHRMPKRLLELVQQYPYVKGSSPSPEHGLLPRPRFSTTRYDALFVRLDTELPSSNSKPPAVDLLQLIADAIKAEAPGTGGHYQLWQKVRQAGAEDDSRTSAGEKHAELNRILDDETVRLLSLRTAKEVAKEPVFKLDLGSKANGNGHSRSISADVTKSPSTNGVKSPSETSSPSSPSNNVVGIDWNQFSDSGFLDSGVGSPLAGTLMDRDVEVTVPKEARSRSVGRRSRAASPRLPRKSSELAPLSIPSEQSKIKAINGTAAKLPSKVTQVSVVQLDEAFIDFWSDALLDPISSDWPRFIICRFKNSMLGLENEGKKVEWMVIEQAFSKPASPPATATSETTRDSHATSAERGRGRTASPRPSFSDVSGIFSSTSKRFSFLSGSKSGKEKDTQTTKKKGNKSGVKVGEMGEILKEEDSDEGKSVDAKFKKRSSLIPRKSVDPPAVLKEESAAEKEAKKDKGDGAISSAGAAALATGVVAGVTGATVVAAAQELEPEIGKSTGGESTVQDESQPAEVSSPSQDPTDQVDSTEPTSVDTPAASTQEESQPDDSQPTPVPEPTSAPVDAEESKLEDIKEGISAEPTSVNEGPSELELQAEIERVEAARKAEEEAEAARKAAEDAERTRLEAEEAEAVHKAAAEAERARLEAEEAEAARKAAEEAERAKSEAEELARKEAEEKARLERTRREEEERLRKEEEDRLRKEEDERLRREEEKLQREREEQEELARIQREKEEQEERARLELEAQQQAQLDAEKDNSVVHVEPLRDPSPAPAEEDEVSLPPVPVVDAKVPITEPSSSVPPVELTGETPSPSEPSSEPIVDSGLPPAPESVVLSGETPGPQIALSSSEPAAAALAEKESESDGPNAPPGLSVSSEASDVAKHQVDVNEEGSHEPSKEDAAPPS